MTVLSQHVIDKRCRRLYPAKKVKAVDCVAAGDTFNGAFVVALDFIHARQPRAKVILALTTFARNGPGVPDRIRARNSAALRQAALRPWIAAVDDLYAVTAADPDAHLNADNVHFNSKGTHELVQAVAKSIRSVLVR